MKRYRKYMSEVVAGAQVNGMEAIFAIIAANERDPEECLDALGEAREDLNRLSQDLDVAIASLSRELADETAKKMPASNAGGIKGDDLAQVIVDIARMGAGREP